VRKQASDSTSIAAIIESGSADLHDLFRKDFQSLHSGDLPPPKDSGNREAFRASRVTANQREATTQFLERLLLAKVL
jgi:hypothetical protein